MGTLGIGGLGLPEMLVIGGIFVLLFGGKKFKEMGRGMGDAIVAWKQALREGHEAEDELKK